jgi:hypothetical protein
MNDFSAVQRLLDLEARLWVSREHAGPPVEGGVRLVGVLGWNAGVPAARIPTGDRGDVVTTATGG